MAKSTRTPSRNRKLTQFPNPDPAPESPSATSTAVLDPPAQPATPFDAAPAPEPEKPRKTPKTLTFFQRVASIDRADWGDRAKIKVYRLAPLINRLVGSEHKFVTIYGEPLTEEKLKIDHGSGRYRLYLNCKTAGIKDEKEIDMVELDILDPAFPPKIPPGEWLDDPRNKQWAWARPAGAGQQQPGAQNAAEGTLAAFDTFLNIQDRVQERMTPPAAPQPGQPGAAPAPVDPWAAAEKILNMRSENPMVAILQQQMKDSAAAAEAERERAFKASEAAREREFKLQQQLLEAKSAPTTAPKTLLDQIGELVGPEAIKTFVGKLISGNGTLETAGRTVRTTGMDILNNLVTGPAGERLAGGLSVLISNLASATTPNSGGPLKPPPVVLSGTNPDGTAPQENPEQRIQRIGETITRAMLFEFFLKDEESGEAFAQWMFDGAPKDYLFIRSYGAEELVRRYRRVPEAWPVIQAKETEFLAFLKAFCAWDPNTEDGPVPPGNGDDGVVDLESEAQA